MDLLKQVIEQQRKNFIPEYQGKATDAECLGMALASYFRWDGVSILQTAYAALEDSGYHAVNEVIEKLITRENPCGRNGGPVVVCLCGSTRFSQAFREANLRETLAGKLVLSVGIDTKSDTDLLMAGEITTETKMRLDELHMRKIELADEVLVLNVGGYVGESTSREVAYAQALGKPIRWLEEVTHG